MDQAEFQSIVSGEDIQVNVKFQKAFATEWSTPGILAGNEVPLWVDSGGSIQRRVLLFDFIKTVVNADMKLDEKLDTEAPYILVKCNRAYLEAARAHGHKNIWTVVPDYFLKLRAQMAETTNVLAAFMVSTEVRKGNDLYCPESEFKSALRAFASVNGYPVPKITADYYRTGGVKTVTETREWMGRARRQKYIVGLELVSAEQEDSGLG
jgi:phage/plasmid-associated DNA primase